jgi:Na+-transporting methylmalonyl-CoA/oxaloacetate decarboxylase gamma subunit
MLSLLILIMAIYILSESKDVKQQEIKIEVEVPELKK